MGEDQRDSTRSQFRVGIFRGALEDKVPDAKTVWLYRDQLELDEAPYAEV